MKLIIFILGLFISVAYLTLLERKLLGLIGLRLGPYKISIVGILQPIADALKLFSKQEFSLKKPFIYFYIIVGLLFVSISCFAFTSMDLLYIGNLNISIDIFIVLVLLSVNSLLILGIGWLSYSIYSHIGSLRAVIQVLSYEFLLILNLLIYFSCYGSFDCLHEGNSIIFIIILPLGFLFWLIGIVVEIGRTPFDFVESERELVSGFNTEYGASNFGLIFISEYINIVFFSTLTIFIYFSSDSLLALFVLVFWMVWFRSVLPRTRVDSLLVIAWKILIPLLTLYLFFCFVYFSF